ncbi:MAG: type II 3-dehydroquinate dehydratase [Nitrospinota bacterium]
MIKVLIINGPNLNLLGERETDKYGKENLEEINLQLQKYAMKISIELETFQSNHEGEIVEKIQRAKHESVKFIIINPAAYTHTSVAIRDALLSVNIPAIEVHLSNIYKREEFRHHSMISDIVIGQITGFGSKGYFLALDAAKNYFQGD